MATKTKTEQRREMRDAADAAHWQILDRGDEPNHPSPIRHSAYFALIVLAGFLLNLGVLWLIAR